MVTFLALLLIIFFLIQHLTKICRKRKAVIITHSRFSLTACGTLVKLPNYWGCGFN